jgi:dipeptidyl aminopeptidase/acylaminoacyl peptidase
MRAGAVAGGTLERMTLHVIVVQGAAPIVIQLGETRDTYPIFAGWLPDASGLVIFQMSRDCRTVDVLVADARTGATRKVFRDEGKTFIRIHHDIYYGRKLGLSITPDGKNVLWLSERDGHKHLYRYDLADGRLLGQLTRGDWPVDGVKQVIGEHVYFTAHRDPKRPYDVHLCRVPLKGGDVQQLTEAQGKHNVAFAPDGKVFLDTHSSPNRAPVTELRTVDGKCLNPEVLRASIKKLEAVGFTAPEEFTVKAADGVTDLWGVLYKPHDFKPSRKYPVVEYVYGGPQIAVADHGFPSPMGMGAEALRIAQLGCIVVMLDARGTPERSKAFHDVVYKNWAEALVADHAGAIRQLAERHSFIDGKRVGVTGWSWGGYSSSRLLLEAPDVYMCAASGAPGYNPWASVLYECYLGFPQTEPTAYGNADVVRLAPRLQGALQIACGTSDHFCWPDAMKLAEALIRVGKDFEFVVAPGQGHGFDTPHNEFYQRKRAEFFKRNLGVAEESAS